MKLNVAATTPVCSRRKRASFHVLGDSSRSAPAAVTSFWRRITSTARLGVACRNAEAPDVVALSTAARRYQESASTIPAQSMQITQVQFDAPAWSNGDHLPSSRLQALLFVGESTSRGTWLKPTPTSSSSADGAQDHSERTAAPAGTSALGRAGCDCDGACHHEHHARRQTGQMRAVRRRDTPPDATSRWSRRVFQRGGLGRRFAVHKCRGRKNTGSRRPRSQNIVAGWPAGDRLTKKMIRRLRSGTSSRGELPWLGAISMQQSLERRIPSMSILKTPSDVDAKHHDYVGERALA